MHTYAFLFRLKQERYLSCTNTFKFKLTDKNFLDFDKPVKNDAGELSMSDDSKQKAWLEHYQRLLNAEFDWDPNHLSDESPVEGPPIPITIDMVKKAIS